MINQELLKHFEELEAGRILGDLDAEELQQWESLSKDPSCTVDLSLELTAAAIEAELSHDQETELSDSLMKQLQEDISKFTVADDHAELNDADNIVKLSAWKRAVSTPQVPWAIAALFAILFVANSLTQDGGLNTDQPIPAIALNPTPEEARDAILSNTKNLVELDFGGTDSYNKMTGKVVWSDELQEGYMTLSNLPVNDPSKKQYQLWIVDPTRDTKPVDGGVFDIPEGQSTAVIAINNPLVITNPKAFVITMEQPGGVVVSKQQDVVAIAKAS